MTNLVKMANLVYILPRVLKMQEKVLNTVHDT